MMEPGGPAASGEAPQTVLIVDHEVLIRLSVAQYLRECGFKVIEAASSDEAMTVLQGPDIAIDVVLCDVDAPGSRKGFALAQWIRTTKPEVSVILAGSASSTTNAAADLCENGPLLAKPYEPQLLLERIRRLLADRKKSS